MKDELIVRTQSTTNRAAMMIALLGFIQQNFSLLDPYLGSYGGAVLMLVGLIMVYYREKTTTPVTKRP